MEMILEIIMDIAEVFLEAATDETARKHGKAKAILCLVLVLVILIAALALGIHWLSVGSVFAGVALLALAVAIVAVFVIAAFRIRT